MSQASVVAELREEIDGISAAIKAQKQILRSLEEQQSQARRRLNSALDPIARLPTELQSEIFMLCAANVSQPIVDFDEPPLVFLRVCHLWNDIAISIPRLWTRLRIDSLPHKDPFAELCLTWITRAKHMPLSLSLHGPLHRSQNMKPLLDACVPHLHELSLEATLGTSQVEPHPQFDLLNRTAYNHTAGPRIISGLQNWFTSEHCIELLRNAPALAECHTEGIARYAIMYPLSPGSICPLTLPFLQTLRLGHSLHSEQRSTTFLLNFLTLPALQHLLLTTLDIASTDFVAFVTRSSPPLRTLEIITDGTEDVASFIAIPSIVDLSVVARYYAFGTVLEILANDQTFLPNLRHLSVCPKYSMPVPPYDLVIRLLGVRSLKSFKLILLEIVPVPDDDVLLALRAVAESNGIDIHVGPLDKNLI
ncbi:hypothetical protein R3P38DRAFT_2533057 [Favolaschia claudopus]|uniref:F-box domain-containing protein n=1 Tax=Favolaschia claudopus TaxID=2862362 RepID=A0AAW0B8S9_9AGAR